LSRHAPRNPCFGGSPFPADPLIAEIASGPSAPSSLEPQPAGDDPRESDDLEALDRAGQLFQRDAGLHAGQGGTRAEVNAPPEGQVLPEIRPPRVEPFGVGEHRGVVVRGPEPDHDPRSRGDRGS